MHLIRNISLSLLSSGHGRLQLVLLRKRASELQCPTDIRKTTNWCAGEDAVFSCPCGPDSEYYGYQPTCWRGWPTGAAEWRERVARNRRTKATPSRIRQFPHSPSRTNQRPTRYPSCQTRSAGSIRQLPATSPRRLSASSRRDITTVVETGHKRDRSIRLAVALTNAHRLLRSTSSRALFLSSSRRKLVAAAFRRRKTRFHVAPANPFAAALLAIRR